jgi:hypothetical protein
MRHEGDFGRQIEERRGRNGGKERERASKTMQI